MIKGLLILISTLLTGVNADTMERDVRLKAKADIVSQEICLGDLVEESWVQSRCSSERSVCCRWTLGSERAKKMTRLELKREVAKINFIGVKLNLVGEDSVQITQTHRELTDREVQQRIALNIATKTGEDEKNIIVKALRPQNPIFIALANEADWDVQIPDVLTEQMLLRVVSASDTTRLLGWVQPTIHVLASVYVAKKAIRGNEELKPEDFSIGSVNALAAQASGQLVYKKDQFPVGVRARQSILKGQTLLSGMIERTPSVKLGETVTLILRSDNLRISTKGVVQTNAAIGDMVTVQLSRYNRTFRGRLAEGKLVEVWL